MKALFTDQESHTQASGGNTSTHTHIGISEAQQAAAVPLAALALAEVGGEVRLARFLVGPAESWTRQQAANLVAAATADAAECSGGGGGGGGGEEGRIRPEGVSAWTQGLLTLAATQQEPQTNPDDEGRTSASTHTQTPRAAPTPATLTPQLLIIVRDPALALSLATRAVAEGLGVHLAKNPVNALADVVDGAHFHGILMEADFPIMYVCMYVCIVCMYVCMYICMHVCILLMYTHIHTNTQIQKGGVDGEKTLKIIDSHTHTHTFIYTHTHTHTHTHTKQVRHGGRHEIQSPPSGPRARQNDGGDGDQWEHTCELSEI